MKTSQLDRALDMASAYRDRQDRIVMGLQVVQDALAISDLAAAQIAIADLLTTDLKQSRERVQAWRQALVIAAEALGSTGCKRELSHIQALAPEVFDGWTARTEANA